MNAGARPGRTVDADGVRWFRLRAQHLDVRLPAGSDREAAWAGLQDTAPRSALLELHARMDGVGPHGWESPNLVQVWLRHAAYLVPRADFGVFTVGAMPRDAVAARALDAVADRLLAALAGSPRRYDEIEAAGFPIRAVRLAGPTGRIAVRWDASATWVLPVDRPDVDPEEARLELARRHLAWHAPSSPQRFAKWAGVDEVDGAATFRALGDELAEIKLPGEPRWVLARDLDRFHDARLPFATRMLAPDDSYLELDRTTILGDHPRLAHLDVVELGSRLLNSLAGRILVDGELVGSWGRAGGLFTLAPWRELSPRDRARVETEVDSSAGPLGRPVTIRWLAAPPRR